MRDPQSLLPLDEWFRLRYAMRRESIRKRLLEGADPVLIRVEDELVFLHDQRRRSEAIHPSDYHAWKSICHVPLATYIWLSELTDRPITPEDAGRLRHLVADIDAARPKADPPGRAILDATRGMLRSCLELGVVQSDALARMATETRHPMHTLIEYATRTELLVLDDAVQRLTRDLTSDEWSRLYVVVCANHQARYKESTKLYFQRLLGEDHGQGAQGERRIVYSESAASEHEALDLLATHVFERELAATFLGSPDALQRDLQGDAATRVLDELFRAHPDGSRALSRGPAREGAP